MNNLNYIAVGLLIPTFNRRSYLEKALNSALIQTSSRIEIMVIDNGSKDSTAKFMTSISDPRVRYIVNEKNIGMVGSINKGINLFTNVVEWCTILSDDDELDANFIENLIHSVGTFNAKCIVHSHRIFIDEQGNKIREAASAPTEETAINYIKMRAYGRRETYLTGVLFNRKAFNEINGYPNFLSGLATDDAFIFALSLKDRLVHDHNAVAFIRIHEQAESRLTKDGIIKLRTLKQFEEYCERIARESISSIDSQFNELRQALFKYLRSLYSFWWFTTLEYVLTQGTVSKAQLSELIDIVMCNWDKFTFRLKFSTICFRLTGFLPESYDSYRKCWLKIITLTQFLRKFVGPTTILLCTQ